VITPEQNELAAQFLGWERARSAPDLWRGPVGKDGMREIGRTHLPDMTKHAMELLSEITQNPRHVVELWQDNGFYIADLYGACEKRIGATGNTFAEAIVLLAAAIQEAER